MLKKACFPLLFVVFLIVLGLVSNGTEARIPNDTRKSKEADCGRNYQFATHSFAEACENRWRRFERPVGGSWRADETFIKVRGQLMYLYRAVDGDGNTVERACLTSRVSIPDAPDSHFVSGGT